MAGIGQVRAWAGLAAAVLPLVLGGTEAAALDRPPGAVRLGAPVQARCGLPHRSYRAYPWQIERLLRLLADGFEARRECLLLRHRRHRREPAGCFRVPGVPGVPGTEHRRQPVWVREAAGGVPPRGRRTRIACDRIYVRGGVPRR